MTTEPRVTAPPPVASRTENCSARYVEITFTGVDGDSILPEIENNIRGTYPRQFIFSPPQDPSCMVGRIPILVEKHAGRFRIARTDAKNVNYRYALNETEIPMVVSSVLEDSEIWE